MSVLIKGMEMPSNCYKCHLRQRNGMYIVCPVAHARFSVADVNILDFRLKNCPLVPIPPHGRLIDADVLWEAVYKAWGTEYDPWVCSSFMDIVSNAPTVIPAEGTPNESNDT